MIHQMDSRHSVESRGFQGNHGFAEESPETEGTEETDENREESDDLDEEHEEARVERQVSHLARTFTHHDNGKVKSDGQGGENTFVHTTDEKLDPTSPNFSAKEWIKNLVTLFAQDPDRYPKRTAGFLFRDLSVHGYGKPTDYQKTVSNVLLDLAALPRYLVGSGKQKIQILRNFDGVVKSGEMLVVLGRPGR